MKVLVTGAAGYLGGELVRTLEPHHDLTLADVVLPAGGGDGRWLTCDVTDLEQVRAVVAGQEAVVHTVALVRGRFNESLERFIDVMVKGTWNVAQACAEAGVGRFVNISSITASGWPRAQDHAVTADEVLPLAAPDLFYALSKRVGETIVNGYATAYPELACVNIRPGVIAGDGLNPEPTREHAVGPHWFVYVDVRDLAGAVRNTLALDPAPRGTYAIVAGRPDAAYDWQTAAKQIGYVSKHTWPEV